MTIDFTDFDVIDFLESRDLAYRTSGKNVTSGWVEIECPFCGEDPSQHFGVNLDSGLGHCWICGEKCNSIKLVKEIDDCTWFEAKEIVEEFSQEIKPKQEKVIQHPDTLKYPAGILDGIPKIHKRYLESRNFDAEMLAQKYDLKFIGAGGKWKFRMIIPVVVNGKVVTYTSRDVTGNAPMAYKHLTDSKSIIPIKHTLYNFDRISNNTAILVEGIMDCWRIGDGAVCSFGTQLTIQQKEILTTLDKLYILFDNDAINKANTLALNLLETIPYIEVVELPEGDPADLTNQEAKNIKIDLGV
jgi:DNA primase